LRSTAGNWRNGGHDTTSHCMAAGDAVKRLTSPNEFANSTKKLLKGKTTQ